MNHRNKVRINTHIQKFDLQQYINRKKSPRRRTTESPKKFSLYKMGDGLKRRGVSQLK